MMYANILELADTQLSEAVLKVDYRQFQTLIPPKALLKETWKSGIYSKHSEHFKKDTFMLQTT